MNRVVVTGVGPVSSVGIGVERFARAISRGRSGITPIRSFDASGFPHRRAGEVHDFAPEAHVEVLDPAGWGRSSLLAASAARLAVADAALDLATVDGARIASVIGTTSGESQVMEQLTGQLVEDGLHAFAPELVEQLPAGRLAGAVSEELGASGESVTISTACSASNYAIGYAYDLLASGAADVALAGGADSVCRWAHAGFYRLGALAEHMCCPFDKDRTGILTGEGGAVLLLETMDHAVARRARRYAEVLGYGLNCDASHMVAPNADSIAACMRLAHERAGIAPCDVDYISAHGTGTPANDKVEAVALKLVFGDRVPPVSSIKSMLGHTMGAASGFAAIASVLAIRSGVLPPTINWSTADPEIPWIDPVPNEPRRTEVRVVQNDGFAFGGNNAIVMLGAVA